MFSSGFFFAIAGKVSRSDYWSHKRCKTCSFNGTLEQIHTRPHLLKAYFFWRQHRSFHSIPDKINLFTLPQENCWLMNGYYSNSVFSNEVYKITLEARTSGNLGRNKKTASSQIVSAVLVPNMIFKSSTGFKQT